MLTRLLFCCFLLLLNSETLADAYLCTAKYAAGVTEKDDDVTAFGHTGFNELLFHYWPAKSIGILFDEYVIAVNERGHH